MSTSHPALTPFRLRKHELSSRYAVAPMTRVSASPEGVPTQDVADYYAEFADGGFPLVITEGVYSDAAPSTTSAKSRSVSASCRPSSRAVRAQFGERRDRGPTAAAEHVACLPGPHQRLLEPGGVLGAPADADHRAATGKLFVDGTCQAGGEVVEVGVGPPPRHHRDDVPGTLALTMMLSYLDAPSLVIPTGIGEHPASIQLSSFSGQDHRALHACTTTRWQCMSSLPVIRRADAAHCRRRASGNATGYLGVPGTSTLDRETRTA